ncbi:MAG: family 16 glycosylhydrolase [Chloroflexota bacterium]
MNRTVSTLMSTIMVFTLTLGNYFSAGASADSFSGNTKQSDLSRSVLIQTGGPSPFGQAAIGWNLTFADEFSGTTLDLTKWRPNWLGGSDTSITKPVNSLEVSCYDPAQATVLNGELNLTAVQRTCSSWNYASGLIQSNGKFNFTYGYVEAKIWTPAGTGMWPAFWADGPNWPVGGEMDVLEAYGTDISTYHYHYAGCGGDCGPGGEVNVPGATAGWHVYAANWEPGAVTWYYDGQQVWKNTTGVVSVPQYLILNLGLESSLPAVPAVMRVDYVRVWKSVAPAPTITSTPQVATPTLVLPTATLILPSPTNTATLTSMPTILPTLTATKAPTKSPTATLLPPTATKSPTPTMLATATTKVIEVRVAKGADDVEEYSTGYMYIDSSDLELVYDVNNQVVGMRFVNVTIPKGAVITNAYLQFKVDETSSTTTPLTIRGEASPNAVAFTTAIRNLSSRLKTIKAVGWSPLAWLALKAAGTAQRTPNLAGIVQEIVNQSGWASGNSLVMIITGSSKRVAEAYEVNPAGAPLLHIEYTIK